MEDGAVTELSTYIVNARIEISMWLRRYMQEHPLQCYHRTYTFSDALDFVNWKEFMDTASNLLLRLAILIQGTAEGTEGYVNFIVDSRIERYTARFLLQYLKEATFRHTGVLTTDDKVLLCKTFDIQVVSDNQGYTLAF